MPSECRAVMRMVALTFALLLPVVGTVAQEADEESLPPTDLELAEQAVREMEARYGAFGPQLGDVLVDAASRYREAGQPKRALALYRRHLLLLRVNDGPYSIAQKPTLESILETQAALGDWEDVHDTHLHLLWLARRNHRPGSRDKLPALKRAYDWHQSAFAFKTGRDLEYHYEESKSLYREGLKLIESTGGTEREALCYWHKPCCNDEADPRRKRGCPPKLRPVAKYRRGPMEVR